MNRGRGAQLAYVLFPVGILEVGAALGLAVACSTTAVAHAMPFFGPNRVWRLTILHAFQASSSTRHWMAILQVGDLRIIRSSWRIHGCGLPEATRNRPKIGPERPRRAQNTAILH